MVVREYNGSYPIVEDGVYIAPQTEVIGQVIIGEDSSIWPMTVIRGDMNRIQIGARTNIQDGSVIHVTHDSDYNKDGYSTIIGDDVTVGHKAMLHGCTINDLVLIGIGAIILDGVVVESEVMVGAGSLVSSNKVLESGYLYLGTPAKKSRLLTDKEREYVKYSAMHYVHLKNNAIAAMSRECN